MSMFLAEHIVSHQEKCSAPRYVTGLIIYWPTLYELFMTTTLGRFLTRILRPLFAARILYCTYCGDLWVPNGTASLILRTCEFFTSHLDEHGYPAVSRTMFLDNLSASQRERLLGVLGVTEEEEEI